MKSKRFNNEYTYLVHLERVEQLFRIIIISFIYS